MSVVWSFGAILNNDLRRLFEDYFLQYKRRFDTKLSSHAGKSARDSMFEKAFDIERMQWDLISERVSSKIGTESASKSFMDAQRQQIIVPSLEISQGLLLFDILMQRKSYHIMFEGQKASQKTMVLNNISRLKKYNYRSIWIPMTATVTIDKARYVFEQFFKTSENRFVMSPVDGMKHIFIIDDLHMEDNLNTKFSEFFRMWDIYGGYYHIENGYFVNIEKLRLLLAKNSNMPPNTHRANDRLTYYINSVYFDDLDNDRFRMFVQNWLTNKSISFTSKLVNKFYILITNSLMSIKDKMSRNDAFSEFQILPIFNFHHFVRLCNNFSTFSMMLDEQNPDNEKEEGIIAKLLAFELSNIFGDRIMNPQLRNEFLTRIQEVCKHNFLVSDVTADKINELCYGNFHELYKQPSNFVYTKNKPEDFPEIINQIKKKFKADLKSKNLIINSYLEVFLEIPGALRQIYKIARLIKAKNSHICLIGPPGAGTREYLQLACLISSTNNQTAILFEPNVRYSVDVIKFRNDFRKAMVLAVKTKNEVSFLIDDTHIDDIIYFDYVANFLTLFDNDSIELFDHEFCQELIKTQRQVNDEEIESLSKGGMKGNLKMFKSTTSGFDTADPSLKNKQNDKELYIMAINTIIDKFHVVINFSSINKYKYYAKKYSCFETKMSCMYIDDISNEQAFDFSYQHFKNIAISNPSGRTSQEQYQDDEEIEKRTKDIAKRIVEVKSKIYNNILDFFYQNSSIDGSVLGESDDDSSFKLSNERQSDKKIDTIANNISNNMKKIHTLDIPVSTDFNSKYRYILFNEMISYLYEFLSSSLLVIRNYYESLVLKTNDLSNFYSTTHSRKKDLHNRNLNITLQLMEYKDRISKVNTHIKDKQNTLKSQLMELAEHDETNTGGNQKQRGFMSNKSDIELAINFTQKAIADLENELKRLNQSHNEIKVNLGSLEEVISDTEISNVRSAQILNSIIDHADVAKKKLDSVKKRIKNILGDSILLAVSIVYLGVFSLKNRVSIRRKIRDMLAAFDIN